MDSNRFIEVRPDWKTGGTILLAIEHIVEVRREWRGDVAYAVFHLVNHTVVKTLNPFNDVIPFLGSDPIAIPVQLPMDEPQEISPPKPRPFGPLPGAQVLIEVDDILERGRAQS